MAKVLKSSRAGVATYKATRDSDYITRGGKLNPLSQLVLVMDDEQAEYLLKKYPDELKEVPEKNWPEIYKNKVKAFKADRFRKASKDYPDLVKSPDGDSKKTAPVKPTGGK